MIRRDCLHDFKYVCEGTSVRGLPTFTGVFPPYLKCHSQTDRRFRTGCALLSGSGEFCGEDINTFEFP